jgi:hypothetical protein
MPDPGAAGRDEREPDGAEPDGRAAVERAFRESAGRAVATLVRVLGHTAVA